MCGTFAVPAHKNHIKMATITHATAVGRVALLQETHWSDHDACIWATMFPARSLVAAPAVRGPLVALVATVPPREGDQLVTSALANQEATAERRWLLRPRRT